MRDHLKKNRYVKQICRGEYFGEISILTESLRTATVKSSNYCTLACLKQRIFFELCNNFPEIIMKMKLRSMEYKDPWKKFKLMVLQQIDYFNTVNHNNEFFDEIQYYLNEEYVEAGTEIVSSGEHCSSLIFLVQGQIELVIYDENGNESTLELLNQGDVIGQYSVLFDEEIMFSVFAKTNVRILTLSQEFFRSNLELIDGLEEAILEAEDIVDVFGIPICDYRVYQ